MFHLFIVAIVNNALRKVGIQLFGEYYFKPAAGRDFRLAYFNPVHYGKARPLLDPFHDPFDLVGFTADQRFYRAVAAVAYPAGQM